MEADELPWTGERLVPSLAGQIASEHLHRYALACDMAEGRDVLDIACGEGYGSALLAKRARSVVGVDIDKAAVDHAQRKYGGDRARFLVGQCTAIPLPDASVDMVVSFETIEHIREHDVFLSEVRRVLRSGGLVVISTPERGEYDRSLAAQNPFHVKELSREEFESLLRGRFRHTAVFSQRFCASSVVLGDRYDGTMQVGSYSGGYGKVAFSEKMVLPTYFIAFCSDAPLPELRAGIFEFTERRPEGAAVGSEPCLQVFADAGAGYHESASMRQTIAGGDWQTVTIRHLEQMPTAVSRRIRIDPVNRTGVVTLSKIRIFREKDGTALYVADSGPAFARIDLSGGLLAPFNGKEMVILAATSDPQLYLPPLGDPGPDPYSLEVTMKFAAGDEAVFQEISHLIGTLHGAIASAGHLIGTLHGAIASAEAWQKRSWVKRAFHRWQSPLADTGRST